MNKKIKNIFLILLIFISTSIVYVNFYNKDKAYENEDEVKVKHENALSMMIEQTAGAGDYVMETRSSWPADGYKFNTTLSKCENGSEIYYDAINKVVMFYGTSVDKCYIYFDIYVPTFAEYIIDLYNQKGTSQTNIYYHNSSLTNGAGDNSYRYAGASSSVNNYICFGSTEATCPTDNLYRIIGIFNNQVKIIKSTSIGSYAWDSNGSNTWSTSSLNSYLNTTFLTSLISYNDYIDTTTWKVGSNAESKMLNVTPSTAYQNEITNPVTTNTTDNATTYSAKIGLMYVSDFYYAASQTAWTKVNYTDSGSVYDYRSEVKNDWLYLNINEWTISRNAYFANYAFFVYTDGHMSSRDVGFGHAVRPVFFLAPTIIYDDGEGTSSNPFRVRI